MNNEQDELGRLQSALQHRYQLKKILGRGGMSTVYLAEDPRHSRHLALKVLRAELTATIGANRFHREIRTIAGLTHPHILPLFDSGEADGFLFYVMPYVEGESLRQRIKHEGQFPVDETIRIAAEVADALSFAHGRGVIHRDIKPENILFEAGHAVVSDFGIAKAITVAAGDDLTEIGFTIGTPLYMSPEQAAADPSVDGRSDLYSLGCVVYEMLGGSPPFAGTLPPALLAKKLLETVPGITTSRQDVPKSVELAVARALERNPANRFQTMLQFANALNTTTPVSSEGPRDVAVHSRIAGKDLAILPIEMRPLDEELDIYGLTHPGKIERVNQDHFLMCSIRREMHFHQTSLPDVSLVPRKGQRRAFVAIVADGIGRTTWGELASRTAIEVLTQQLMHSIDSFKIATDEDETAFVKSLYAMGVQCQASVQQKTWENAGAEGTTFGLTLWIGMWPRAYALQIGVGNLYRWVDGQLSRLSAITELDGASPVDGRDAAGGILLTPKRGDTSLPGVGAAHPPAIYRHDQRWNAVGMICTRGLTKLVSERQIADRLRDSTSAKNACEQLLEDALANGGTHNITVVVGRTMPQPPS